MFAVRDQLMLRLSVQALKLQLTSAAVMSLCAAMERVFLCLNAVTGLNITVLTALTSSTAVCFMIFALYDQKHGTVCIT